MRFQLENLKTATGLNKKAIKSNVPVLPPPSSTYHSLLRCSGPPAQSVMELAPAPGLQQSRAAVWISAAECTKLNIHQFIIALCIRENVFQTAAPLPAVLLGRCMNTPCSTCSNWVLVCCVFAKPIKKPINCGNTCIGGWKAWNSSLLCYCYCSGYNPKA